MPVLLGRRAELALLREHVARGHFVLLYGPRGVGKSALIDALGARCREAGLSVGASARSRTLADLTLALSQAYPDVVVRETSQRQARSRLRLAAEARPCVLLLDHLTGAGSAFKSALRALRGTGSAAVIAADVDRQREHERVRALHLTHHEIELRRLGDGSMRSLFAALFTETPPRHALGASDVAALVRAAEGLPGRATWFAEQLAAEAAWRSGRVRAEWLKTEALARSVLQQRAGASSPKTSLPTTARSVWSARQARRPS
jgi:AAA+ superfamily predicted ATPase